MFVILPPQVLAHPVPGYTHSGEITFQCKRMDKFLAKNSHSL